jgi:hypothetical protein
MADHGKHASHVDGSRALAPQETKALGPQSIGEEIQPLCGVGLYAMPVHMYWDESKDAKAKKAARFPWWQHIRDPESWRNSINHAMQQVRDANGVAILTEASGCMRSMLMSPAPPRRSWELSSGNVSLTSTESQRQ